MIEFKLDESAKAAIEQIQQKTYQDKCQHQDKKLIGLGINFSSQTKSVGDWQTISFLNNNRSYFSISINFSFLAIKA